MSSVRRYSRFNMDDFIAHIFDEARGENGTWSSVTINDLQHNQSVFTPQDTKLIVDGGYKIIMENKETISTKFKIAQLFSQLFNMKFPYFNENFEPYIDSLSSYIEKPQNSYLWKPIVNLISGIILKFNRS